MTTQHSQINRDLKAIDPRIVGKVIRGVLPCIANVKLIMGTVCNVAVWQMMDGFHAVTHSGQYRHEVKKAFRQMYRQLTAWEYDLRHSGYFQVKDIPEEHLKRFHEGLTYQELFEFWQGLGSLAYTSLQPHMEALRHKLYTFGIRNGLNHKDAQLCGTVLMTVTTLQLAVRVFDWCIECVMNDPGFRKSIGRVTDTAMERKVLNAVFLPFNMTRLALQWQKASELLKACNLPLTEEENHNIELSIGSFTDIFLKDDKFYYECYMKAVEDTDEIFASLGQQKKMLREIAEAID